MGEWHRLSRPVGFVQHNSSNPLSPLHPSSPGNALKSYISGTPDLLVQKTLNLSFHGTPDLDSWLRENATSTIVICGITTNHCCEKTVRIGENLGYTVYFAVDAAHTFDRTDLEGGMISAAELSRNEHVVVVVAALVAPAGDDVDGFCIACRPQVHGGGIEPAESEVSDAKKVGHFLQIWGSRRGQLEQDSTISVEEMGAGITSHWGLAPPPIVFAGLYAGVNDPFHPGIGTV